ncbi:MAG: phosphoenolpyruvate--protein phosphotransferase [Pyrinomonadaceae bacterium]
MVERILTVIGQLGLHARAAAKLVRVAAQFQSSIKLERVDTGQSADAKSILNVLMLAASSGTSLRTIAVGPDEAAALDALDSLFRDSFGETKVVFESPPYPPSRQELRWKGLGVSEGVVIGRVLRMHGDTTYVYRSRIEPEDVDREQERFRSALHVARRELQAVKTRAENELGKEHAYVFDAHLLLLEDAKLIARVEGHISQELANAEWAVKVVGDQLISVYSEVKDSYLRERAADIDDVVQRLLRSLSGENARPRQLAQDSVIVSQDLLPSAVAQLDLQFARAIATDSGGWTSHTAIIARGLGIPAVVGLRDFFRSARTGDEIVVDSVRGEVVLYPSEKTLQHYTQEVKSRTQRRATAAAPRTKGPLKTRDGIEVRVRANVEVPVEFDGITRYGARGIGLYRSEFLLSRRGVTVSEEEQVAAYAEVARLAGEDGAIVRLFDLGAEDAPGLPSDPERNPALGLRAIRFGLRHETVMRTQVRAILRAATEGHLDIVLPMVADVADVQQARAIVESESEKLAAEGFALGKVGIGAMIEVPSAVLTADKLARNVDFFELGTNDLVQYTLAVDRSSDQVAGWFRTLHPAVLLSIERSLAAAHQAGIPAIVCGEMASTPVYAVLLVGLGANDLSMTPISIPRVSTVLAAIDSREAAAIARECLECATADEVEDLVRERFRSRWPDLFPDNALPQPREHPKTDA